MKNRVATFIKALLWGCLVIVFPVASGALSTVLGADTVKTLFIQGGFMAVSLVPPLVLVLSGKWRWDEIGFGGFNARGCRRALYFIPLVAVLVPAAVCGFCAKPLPYALGSLFLYLLVGIAEEVYFRGIVPKYLGKAFSQRGIILLSTLIFGVGHLATAFTGGGALDTALTVLNAFIFGWLAIEAALLSGNIAVPALLHFLFDFETKFAAMSVGELMLAELVRGAVMVILAVWLAFVIKGKSRKPATDIAPERRAKLRKRRITLACVTVAVVLLAGIALAGLSLYGKKQAEKIPAMSFEDCLEYTLGGNAEGVITVGVIKNGRSSYMVYGENGKELPSAPHTYEIGSLTKTFTAALIQKAVEDGKLRLSDTLDKYLALPSGNSYPTIAELLTHTSGFKDWYFETPMIGNFFSGRNDFCGVTGDMALQKLRTLDMKGSKYPFAYSNYGYAVLGLVLEKACGEEYTALVNGYAAELGLAGTHVSNGGGLSNHWDWREGDAYFSAGALTSNIEDMLRYAQLQLDGAGVFGECHKVIKRIDATTASNAAMEINMDSIGMAWITDEKNGVVWHNGGTGHYNCYVGFCPTRGTAVVVLSNLAPDYRIPATVMGVKLLTEAE